MRGKYQRMAKLVAKVLFYSMRYSGSWHRETWQRRRKAAAMLTGLYQGNIGRHAVESKAGGDGAKAHLVFFISAK